MMELKTQFNELTVQKNDVQKKVVNYPVLEKEIELDCRNVKTLALITSWRSHKVNGGLPKAVCASLDDMTATDCVGFFFSFRDHEENV